MIQEKLDGLTNLGKAENANACYALLTKYLHKSLCIHLKGPLSKAHKKSQWFIKLSHQPVMICNKNA